MNPPYNLNRYRSDLEKYIDFLESNQKEFVEWLQKERDKAEYQMYESTYQEVLTKLKEL